MPKISHYIITRFNLRAELNSPRAISEEWLNHRFDLFEKFCLPTVKSQTVLNFDWLLLFDSETPRSIRLRLERACEFDRIKPIFLPPGTPDVGRKAVMASMGECPEILITTRLDNDDGLAKTYVETVQSHCQVAVPTVFDFTNGYVWQDGRVYRDRQPRSAFATLVEPLRGDVNTPYSTIYRGSHRESHNLGRLIEISKEPSWLQVVHGGNLENRARGVRIPLSELVGRFGLDGDLFSRKENAIAFTLDVLRTQIVEATRRLWHLMH